MNQEIIQKIKNLKEIKADDAFRQRSRALIFGLKPKRKPLFFNFGFVLATSLALIFIVFSSFIIFQNKNNSTSISSITETEEINSEFQYINFQLKEITYRQNIHQKITVFLDEMGNPSFKNLKKENLEDDLNNFKLENPLKNKDQVDQLLKSLTE